MKQLATLLEQNDLEPQTVDVVPDVDYDEKRAWKSLSGGGWGKRSEWGSFRGDFTLFHYIFLL